MGVFKHESDSGIHEENFPPNSTLQNRSASHDPVEMLEKLLSPTSHINELVEDLLLQRILDYVLHKRLEV
jgi:hypothetical protein